MSCSEEVQIIWINYFKSFKVPFVTNFQSGHNKPFINLPVGLKVKLDTYSETVTVLESLFLDK